MPKSDALSHTINMMVEFNNGQIHGQKGDLD